MAFPVTGILDSGSGTDADPIAGIWSGPMVTGDRQVRRVSNQFAPHSVDGYGNSYLNGATYGPDVEAYCTLRSAFPASSRIIFWLRGTPGASPTGYKVTFWNSGGDFLVVVAENDVNIGTALDPEPNTMASGDSFGCALVGNVVEVFWKVGAGAWTSWGTRTGVSATGSGRIGLGFQGSTALRADGFGGGAISSLTLDSCLPDADVVTTGWSTAPLFSKINDASDSTVITATAS